MRTSWTYKKLGDICSIERGGSPRPITDYITDSADGINWIKIGDATEGSKYISSTKEKIKPEGMKKSRFVHKGDFILSNSMSFGRPYILDIDGCIHDGWLVIHDDNFAFVKDYLFYLLSSPVMYSKFQQLAVGGVVNNLNSTLVKNVVVPVPDKKVQLTIALEFDRINELIALKNKQLQDFDFLSQSIFYNLFGDPILNEKGWKTKKIGDIAESDLGKTLNSAKDKGEYYPYLCAVNILWNRIDFTTLKTTKFENSEIERYSVRKGDLLICEGGDIGRAAIWDKDESILYQNALHRVRFNNEIIPIYCLYYIWALKKIGVLDGRYGKGVTIKHLVKSSLMSIPIPIPPISLQNEFAKTVELIEIQKKHVISTIKDLETLLASRMQYWFG